MKDHARITKYVLLSAAFLVLGLGVILAGKLPTGIQGTKTPLATLRSTEASLSIVITNPLPSPSIELDPTFSITSEITRQNLSTPSPSICSEIWGINLPADLPAWLTTPASAEDLYTEVQYVFLAGDLIKHGIVNADDCPGGGVTPDGVSTTCGMEKAYSEVVLWQNLFDQEIFAAALQNQVPAQLLKRLFAQETQFWPDTEFTRSAYGIGNVTSPGIDPLFRWNQAVYQNTCQGLIPGSCSQPYSELQLADQQRLRGYFITQNIDAYCPSCSHGIDLEKTKKSIAYFAKLLVADCNQVGLILNNYGFSSKTLSYEDAWQITLANYTAGSGCIENGLGHMDASKNFTWDLFTKQIDANCDVNSIINKITR